jgi:tape measure domain-containing protein
MATIDERVVSISFENSKFQTNVAQTMGTLDKLNIALADVGKKSGLSDLEKESGKVTFSQPMSALDKLKAKFGLMNAGNTFTDMERAADRVTLISPMTALDRLKQKLGMTTSGTTFTDMEASADRVSFAGLTRTIDGIGNHFTALQATAAVAFGNIAAVAAQKLASVTKSFTLDPITEGFKNYETQINAVQTIQANTGLTGKKGLGQITAALNNLNKYANLTIYNFSEMAKNIGTFTAAGVKLGPATESIKGIANLAALSGSNSQQASGAMYQLSQAIAAGKVGLQDWNSVVSAGMAGAVFQKSLIRTGQAMGTIAKGAVEIDKKTGAAKINGESFRQSIAAKPGEKSWLTSDVLVKTLGQFTGDATKAQLAAEGFNASQIKAIQAQAKTAVDAATKVKTFSQLMQSLKEEVSSAWAGIFKTLFGNIDQAKMLFSGLHNFLENALTGPLNRFNKTLDSWAKLGGRTELLAGLKQAFKDVSAVLKPIHEAFRDIFPPTTARSLLDLTKNFKSLMDQLKIGPQTAENLRRTFRGVFSVLDIGWNIVKDLVGVFFDLFHAAAPAAGGILSITGGIGDFLVKVDNAVKKGHALAGVFRFIGGVLSIPIKLLGALGGAIGSLFQGKDVSGAARQFGDAIGGLANGLGPLPKALDGVTRAWRAFINMLGQVKQIVAPYLHQAADAVKGFGDSIANALGHANWGNIFAAVQTGILGGIFLAIKKALGSGGPIETIVSNFKQVVGGANEVIEGVTGNLKALQRSIQAATLVEIAAAMGILAAAIFVLSTIDPKRISQALGSVAVGMGEMVAAILILRGATTGGLSLPFIAGSIILLSAAMVILATAMKIFATMSWGEIAKGLVGVAGGLSAVGLATNLMNGPKLIVTGLALIPLAIGLTILAGAMKVFGTLSWESMAKGLVGVAGGLTAIGLGIQLMPPTLPLIGLGLIAVSVGLALLAGAVLAFGAMDLGTLVQGILGMAGAIVALGLAVEAIPPTLALQAAGLLVLAVAMTALSGSIAIFGSMDIGRLVQGILAMGGALVVLGLGLQAMSGTIPGSVALLAAATAFAILAPTLALMGALPIGVIIKGLATMAGVLLVLGVAGAVAGPGIVVLGLGILALGAGLAAIGGAVYLFAKGISLLSDKSVKAMAAMIAAAAAFIAVFPSMVINFVKGIVTILGEVVKLAPKIINSLVQIAGDLLSAIVRLAPKIAVAMGAIIMAIIKILDDNAGPIIEAGFHLLEALLSGIARHIGRVTDQVSTIITHFLGALARNIPRIAREGTNVIVAWLRGVTNGIPRIVTAAARLITTFLRNIGKRIGDVIDAGSSIISGIITGIGRGMRKILDAGTNAIVKFLDGLRKAIPRIAHKGTDVVIAFVTAIGNTTVRLVKAGFNVVIKVINGIAQAIRNNGKRLGDAGWNLAWSIIQGAINGIGSLAHHFLDKIVDLGKKAAHLLTHPWEIFSPSRVTYRLARNIMLGLINGLNDNTPGVHKALEDSANSSVRKMNDAFSKIPKHITANTQPIISPVLDLTDVKKKASMLDKLMPKPVITAKVSTDQASAISQHKPGAATEVPQAGASTSVTFHQTNNSPDPLSAIEIYRQTRNQLSQAKRLVGA